MAMHLFQPRSLQERTGTPPVYPSELVAEVNFAPEDAFGVEMADGKRTTFAVSTEARIACDLNVGTTLVTGPLIDRISLELSTAKTSLAIGGNSLELKIQVASDEQAHGVLAYINQLLPILLSYELKLPIRIIRFRVRIGDTAYNYGVQLLPNGFQSSTAEINTQRIQRALDKLVESRPELFRIYVAKAYLRQAYQLLLLADDPMQFTTEIVLHVVKALEIIVSDNRDRARTLAGKWGWDMGAFEEEVIPLFLVRSKFDIAHVATGPLTPSQRKTIADFIVGALATADKYIGLVASGVDAEIITLDGPPTELSRERMEVMAMIEKYITRQAGTGRDIQQPT
jgi:hypothetical protein